MPARSLDTSRAIERLRSDRETTTVPPRLLSPWHHLLLESVIDGHEKQSRDVIYRYDARKLTNNERAPLPNDSSWFEGNHLASDKARFSSVRYSREASTLRPAVIYIHTISKRSVSTALSKAFIGICYGFSFVSHHLFLLLSIDCAPGTQVSLEHVHDISLFPRHDLLPQRSARAMCIRKYRFLLKSLLRFQG